MRGSKALTGVIAAMLLGCLVWVLARAGGDGHGERPDLGAPSPAPASIGGARPSVNEFAPVHTNPVAPERTPVSSDTVRFGFDFDPEDGVRRAYGLAEFPDAKDARAGPAARVARLGVPSESATGSVVLAPLSGATVEVDAARVAGASLIDVFVADRRFLGRGASLREAAEGDRILQLWPAGGVAGTDCGAIVVPAERMVIGPNVVPEAPGVDRATEWGLVDRSRGHSSRGGWWLGAPSRAWVHFDELPPGDVDPCPFLEDRGGAVLDCLTDPVADSLGLRGRMGTLVVYGRSAAGRTFVPHFARRARVGELERLPTVEAGTYAVQLILDDGEHGRRVVGEALEVEVRPHVDRELVILEPVADPGSGARVRGTLVFPPELELSPTDLRVELFEVPSFGYEPVRSNFLVADPDDPGRYEFELDLAPGRYRFDAAFAGVRRHEFEVEGGVDVTLSFGAAHASTLRLDVRDGQTGAPVEPSFTSFNDTGVPKRNRVDAASFAVVAGDYWVTLRAEGYRTTGTAIRVGAGLTTARIELEPIRTWIVHFDPEPLRIPSEALDLATVHDGDGRPIAVRINAPSHPGLRRVRLVIAPEEPEAVPRYLHLPWTEQHPQGLVIDLAGGDAAERAVVFSTSR